MAVIVVAPDSYKGSMSADMVARSMEVGIRRVIPTAEIKRFPMADGGEGTVHAVLSIRGGEKKIVAVSGALLAKREVEFGVFREQEQLCSVIEVAAIVGLPCAPGIVEERSSYGVGELIKHCMDIGVRKVLVGLGGSSTNDGGAGVLVALGARLCDQNGAALPPTLEGLKSLHCVDFSQVDRRLDGIEIVILADVDNPLCGLQGATSIFGPQKGIKEDHIEEYDRRLRRLAKCCDEWAKRNLSGTPGAGAAGGIGYSLKLFGAKMVAGADMVCQMQDIDRTISAADWVLTGEGHSDGQTLRGKAPYEVARRARRLGKPVSLLSGGVNRADLSLLAPSFDGCFSIIPAPMDLNSAIQSAELLVADAAEQLARLRFG
jgi:glycerate kinase